MVERGQILQHRVLRVAAAFADRREDRGAEIRIGVVRAHDSLWCAVACSRGSISSSCPPLGRVTVSFKKFITQDQQYWTGFPTAENPSRQPLYWFMGGRFTFPLLTPAAR